MSEQSNGFHPAEILTFDGELVLPTAMQRPGTLRSTRIDQQFARHAQRMERMQDKTDLGEVAMTRLHVSSDRALRDGFRGLYALLDEEDDPRIKALLQLRLERESLNDLSKATTAIKRIGIQGVAHIVAEAFEEPHESSTVIEVQPQPPGLLRRLFG